MSEYARKLREAVCKMEEEKAILLAEQARDNGADPKEILKEGLLAAEKQITREYKNGERLEAEWQLAWEAIKDAVVVLRPLLTDINDENTDDPIYRLIKRGANDHCHCLAKLTIEKDELETINLVPDTPESNE